MSWELKNTYILDVCSTRVRQLVQKQVYLSIGLVMAPRLLAVQLPAACQLALLIKICIIDVPCLCQCQCRLLLYFKFIPSPDSNRAQLVGYTCIHLCRHLYTLQVAANYKMLLCISSGYGSLCLASGTKHMIVRRKHSKILLNEMKNAIYGSHFIGISTNLQ